MTVVTPDSPPRFGWENLTVGDDLGCVEGRVGASTVRAHSFAIGDEPESYVSGLGDAPLVPPTLFINDLLKLFLLGYDCSPPMVSGLHTRAQIDVLAPVRVGEQVRITGTHIAKFMRRGRRHRSCLSTLAAADGTEFVRMLATETVGFERFDEPDSPDQPENWAEQLPKVTDEVPAGAPVLRPGNEPVAGAVIIDPARPISYEQSVVFSGFPFAWAHEKPQPIRRSSIHISPEKAAESGYDAPVAQGLVSASHVISAVVRQFGEPAMHGSKFAFTFIAPVLVGTELTSAIVIDEVGEREVLAHAFTKNSEGRVVTVAHARIPR